MATPYEETKDGFESQMAVNYLGHFLLTHRLLPQLIAGSNDGKNARIVNVSSCIHRVAEIDFEDFHSKYEFLKKLLKNILTNDLTFFRKSYYPADAYGKSKLAQVYFTKYLEMMLREKGLKIQVHAAHPGIVDTDLFKHSSNTYIPWFKQIFYKVLKLNDLIY